MTDRAPSATRAVRARRRRRRPAHRYTAALAQEIELRWQECWDADGTFEAPNPAGPLADPDGVAERGPTSCSCSTCSRTRRAPASTSATRSASSAPTSTPATSGWPGATCCTRWASTRSACRPSSTPCRPAQHPADHDRRRTSPPTAASMRRLGLSHDRRRVDRHDRPGVLPLDAVDLLPDLRLAGTTPTPSARTAASAGPARSASCVAEFDAGTARAARRARVVDAVADRAAPTSIDGHRLAYVVRRAGQLVPGPGHRRRQRGGHRRRSQRPRQLPGVQAQHAPVDDAHHRLRRPPDRRPRPPRLDRLDEDDAAQLDRPLARAPMVDFDSPAGPITVFTTRPDTLFGATFMVLAPGAPAGRRPDDVATHGRRPSPSTSARPRRRKDIDRQDEDRQKTGVFTGSYATNPVTGQDVPIWIADYVLMGYGTGAIMAVPCGDQRDFEFARSLRARHPGHPAAARRVVRGARHRADARHPRAGRRRSSATRRTSTRPTTGSTSTASTSVDEGIAATNDWLEEHGHGEATITYKLRDWLFSRQRYWGEPFPIVYDERRASPRRCPTSMLPRRRCPRPTASRPRTFDPDDEFSDPESPLDRLDVVGRRRARPRRRAAARTAATPT